MNASDTTAINPRDDGSNKASRVDDTSKPSDPKSAPEVSPGPDTREESNSPK